MHFIFFPHPSRTIIWHLDKAIMDLSQLVNPNVTFSKATLEDIIARYTVKHENSTSTTNKTQQSVRTTLSALSQAYARIHGERPGEDYGDLLWLTLDNLKQPSKYAKARPLFEGFAHPQATPAMSIPVEVTTLRKNLENFRSTLYSAAQHLKTLNLSDADRKSLTKQYNDAYVEFGELSGTLMSDELDKAKTHQPSRRQQSKWVLDCGHRVLWRGLRSRDSTATPQSPRGGCSWYSVVARPGDASDAAVVAAIRRIIRPLLRMRCEQEPHAR
jgi:hypothetical protein